MNVIVITNWDKIEKEDIKTVTYECQEVWMNHHENTAMLKLHSDLVFHININNISRIEE